MDSQLSRVSKSRRVLKIVYDDPDATDSSSDERNNISVDKKTMRKRVVYEIAFPNIQSDQRVDNGLNKNNKCGTPKHEVNKNNKSCGTQNEAEQPSCKYKGVRMRQWGRYSAEIRNPNTGKRNWLGTFDNAEEASKAYEAKRHEFETTYKNGLRKGKRNKRLKTVSFAEPLRKGKRNKRLKTVSFAEPLIASLNDSSKRETSNISISSPELVNNVEVSRDKTNSLEKTDIVQELNAITSVNTSLQLESNWLTLDESELDLVAGDDHGCLDDLSDIDIPFDFDFFGTQFAVYHGIEQPHKRSSVKELPKISKQIKESHNKRGQ
ncbi:unnamed protein product [Lathyrus sativus]|nr:unnamed protein product [Lathyrus sativus]